MIYKLVLRNFDCSLEFVFFSAVNSAFQLCTRKFCLQFSGLRMRNFTWNRFPTKNCWSIPCFHPSWKVDTWSVRWYHLIGSPALAHMKQPFVWKTALCNFQQNTKARNF